MKETSFRNIEAGVILLAASLLLSAIAFAGQTGFFDALKRRLQADGLDAEKVEQVYGDSRVRLDAGAVARYFVHDEARIDYKRYLDDYWVNKARAYMRRQKRPLESARLRYGVSPEVITSILLIETHLGGYLGKRSVLNTLSTMAAMADEKAQRYLWKRLPASVRISWPLFRKKARRKAGWAYTELKALLVYTFEQGIDPLQIKGSYAGAIGLAQFMPSNILAFGRDGNGDGRIDLFDHHDAIESIAAYLKHYGWKSGLDRRRASKVIYHYNHSSYYVDTVLDLADLLKG